MAELKKIILSISTLAGTIIGVGLFSLPYITSKLGFPLIILYFLVLGTIVIIIHLFYAELSLRTPDFKRLPSFVEIYLGKKIKKIAFFTTITGLYGAILAYLIVGGNFLNKLFFPFLDKDFFGATFLYFALGAFFIFFGIKMIAKIEFWGLIFFFLILIFIFFIGLPKFQFKNLFPLPQLSHFFLPYGPILFSLWGASLIPEIEEMLGKRKDLLKKIVVISILIPIIVYLFFIFSILGISGQQTSETALVGLEKFLGKEIINLAFVFGILTTFTSFIALGLSLQRIFCYDLKIPKNSAWALTCFVPLILFLIGLKHFILVISFIGSIMLGIDGILILLMYQKLKFEVQYSRFKVFLIYPLILVFLAGIIYEIIYFLK